MSNYQFLDAYGSVQTAASNVVSGANQPIVQISSVIGGLSIVGTYAEDAGHTSGNPGLFTLGVRNDTVSSITSADLDYSPVTVDSSGRTLNKPFAPEAAVLRGTGSVNGVASIQLLAAGGAGLKTYLTDVSIANTGSVATLVTFTDGDASVIGRTIAPALGGSNLVGLAVPMVTGRANSPINMVAATATSVLYGAAYGFKAQ